MGWTERRRGSHLPGTGPEEAAPALGLTDEVVAKIQAVDGYLHLDEAAELSRSIKDSGKSAPLVIEIGSWRGRSAVALGLAVRDRGSGRVLAIDPHAGVPSNYDQLVQNIERAGVGSCVTPIRKSSHEARPEIEDGSVDVLFIDGEHDYDGISQDIEDWMSALAPGGTVAFNDVSWPGVYRALRELVAHRGSPYRRPRLIRSTLFFDFQPSSEWTRADERALRKLRISLAARRLAHPLLPYVPDHVKRLGNRLTRRLVR